MTKGERLRKNLGTRAIQEKPIALRTQVLVPYEYQDKKRKPIPLSNEDKVNLQRSIKERGIQTPLQVVKVEAEQYVVLAGMNRLKIAQDLGIDTVPAIVRDIPIEGRDNWVDMDNLARRQMTPKERDLLYVRIWGEKPMAPKEAGEQKGKKLSQSVIASKPHRKKISRARKRVKEAREKVEEATGKSTKEMSAEEVVREAEKFKKLETPKEELMPIPGQETPSFGIDGVLEIDLNATFRMDDALKSIKEWARNQLKTAGKRGAPKVTFRCEG